MKEMTEEDYVMLKDAMDLDDLDINIIKSFNNNEESVTKYVTTLMIYNSVKNTYNGLLRFIFITIPIFITFPIWRIAFDIYRSIKEQKLRDKPE